MKNVVKALTVLSDWIQKILQVFLLILGTLLTLVNIAQIAGRDLFFYSLPWSEQFSTWLFVWIVFLGYHLVIKKDTELTIDAIHFKNRKAQLGLEIARDLLSLVMILFFFFASVQFEKNALRFPQKLSSMPVNMYVLYAVMPVSFLLMALQKFTNIAVRFSKLRSGDETEAEAGEKGEIKE